MEGLIQRARELLRGEHRVSSPDGRVLGFQRIRMHTLGRIVLRTARSALRNDCIHIAQSCAYSSMVALFPALIVLATVFAYVPDSAPLRMQISGFLDRILPSDVSPIVQGYFDTSPAHHHPSRALIPAIFVSLTGASGVIVTLMEGIRRAHNLPQNCWTFWRRRRRALLLVPLSLIPLLVASLLVVFGHLLSIWLGFHLFDSIRGVMMVVLFLVRWTLALGSSVGLIALLYHLGTPEPQPWRNSFPGAIGATVMWFLSTLVFGWYVTKFANYSRVYGSLGAGIALLFWLYLIWLSVLCGVEFNVQFEEYFRGEFEAEARNDAEIDEVG